MCLRLSDALTQLENCLLYFFYLHYTILLKYEEEMRYHRCNLFMSPDLVVNERYSWMNGGMSCQ